MIRHRVLWLGSFFLGMLLLSAATEVDAATITTGGSFPASAEVIAATPEQAGFGQDAPVSLAQSFTVDSAFSLQTIFLEYENDSNANVDHTVTMTIFKVDDVQATAHDEPPMPADILLTDSVTFPATSPEPGSDTVARIALDSPLALAASVGTAGYAIRFTDGGDPGWEWLRSTSGSDDVLGGNVYAGGKAYEDGLEKTSGTRDYSLALSSVPEPSGLVLAALAALAGVFRRKH